MSSLLTEVLGTGPGTLCMLGTHFTAELCPPPWWPVAVRRSAPSLPGTHACVCVFTSKGTLVITLPLGLPSALPLMVLMLTCPVGLVEGSQLQAGSRVPVARPHQGLACSLARGSPCPAVGVRDTWE